MGQARQATAGKSQGRHPKRAGIRGNGRLPDKVAASAELSGLVSEILPWKSHSS